jgi:hypothetical protein
LREGAEDVGEMLTRFQGIRYRHRGQSGAA